MPIEITMPKLSDTMTDGTLIKWLKKEGEAIKPGDIIAEVETDKATQELEAFESGTIARIVVPEGGQTPVGGIIVVIAKPGEDVAAVAAAVKAAPTPASPAPASPVAPKGVSVSASGAVVLAHESTATDSEAAVEDHDEGTERHSHDGKIRVSPLARKIAEDRGIDLATVRGTGPDGRIVKRDVLAAASPSARLAGAPPQFPIPPAPAAPSTGTPTPAVKPLPAKLEEKTIPLSPMRQTISRRLVQSKQSIPHFYVSIEIQMDKLIDLRKSANEQLAPEKLSVTDFIARAVAVAIAKVPQVNASFTDTAIIRHGNINLGIAVALDEGLVVPVLREAQTKDLRQISQEIRGLAELARTRKLRAQDMSGATFTITNLGMYGIKDFAAIVNPPEAAILAVGGTTWQPVVREIDGKRQVVPGQVMTVTLSADHRVVDGAVAAAFLADLKTVLENPLTMLI